MRPPRHYVRSWLPALAAGAAVVLALGACAPADEESDTGDGGDDTSAATDCAVESLPLYEEGQLTIATDAPAFEPWFVDNDPTNGKGVRVGGRLRVGR